MNKMTKDFNNDAVIENIDTSLAYDSLKEIPHYDTVNGFLNNLEVTKLDESIENQNESVSKQDCEINAAKKLMKIK